MGDNRNFIIAIFLSVLVFVGWQYFFINPQMEAEQARQEKRGGEVLCTVW